MSILDQLELPDDIDLPQSVQAQLNQRLLWISKRLSDLGNSASSDSADSTATTNTLVGTRSQRLNLTSNQAGLRTQGTEFCETDTGLTYIARPISATSAVLAWYYLTGNQRGTFAGLPTGLTANDTGLLYTITDKNRTLRWNGTGWEFAAWETVPVGFIAGFPADPGTGWHICDGSTIANGELHSDGTLHNVTVADFTTAKYPKWGPTAAGAGAAVVPLITGNTAAASTGITVAAATAGSGSINNPASGTPATVLEPPFAGGGGVTDPQHTHAHGTLVNDALGEPPHYGLVAYQRV